MSIDSADAIEIESAIERLRQERETFDYHKEQNLRWFRLRLAMGYVAVVLLPTMVAISGYVLYFSASFEPIVIKSATGALFVNALGLIVTVWKIVLNPSSTTKLEPVTLPNRQISRSKSTNNRVQRNDEGVKE